MTRWTRDREDRWMVRGLYLLILFMSVFFMTVQPEQLNPAWAGVLLMLLGACRLPIGSGKVRDERSDRDDPSRLSKLVESGRRLVEGDVRDDPPGSDRSDRRRLHWGGRRTVLDR